MIYGVTIIHGQNIVTLNYDVCLSLQAAQPEIRWQINPEVLGYIRIVSAGIGNISSCMKILLISMNVL